MRIPGSLQRLVAFLVVMAIAGGISPGDLECASMKKPIPAAERDRLSKALVAALAAVPAPAKPFALLEGESSKEIAGDAEWDAAAKRWVAPGAASAERIYEVDGSEAERADTVPLEVRVWVNRGASLPEALQSVGGELKIFPLPDAPAVEASMIVLPTDSRVMPQSAAQIANALTVMRIYVGPDVLGKFLRDALEKQSNDAWVLPPGGKPGDARWIVVELYGGKRAVEELAARVPISKLRRLLRR